MDEGDRETIDCSLPSPPREREAGRANTRMKNPAFAIKGGVFVFRRLYYVIVDDDHGQAVSFSVFMSSSNSVTP
jgi:hypothetical protein